MTEMVLVRNICKRFLGARDEVRAVENVSFEVAKGKFFSLVGPSGCGKTTTLRCIAGLERPESGEVRVEGVVVFLSDQNIFIPPHKRNIGMVFQSYAIWPHMNVFDNVAFPLSVGRKLPRREVLGQVEEALALVHLGELKDRPATNLSGGQQQRLALARAIVGEPKLLLLDEPLSNLDAKLRDEMRGELKRVQQVLGITTIYVTHDQSEALSMSDTIGVMNAGQIIQIGEPQRVYEHPANEFVADFIGAANLIKGTITSSEVKGTLSTVKTAYGSLSYAVPGGGERGENVCISIKPEDIELSAHPSEGSSPGWVGKVVHVSFLGGVVDYQISVGKLALRAKMHPSQFFKRGEKVYISFKPHRYSTIPVDKDFSQEKEE